MSTDRSAYGASVERAFRSQEALLEDGAYCSADPKRLAAIGGVAGSQVRIERNGGEYAVYTVAETREESLSDVVRMGRSGRERVGTTEEFGALVESTVVHPTYTDEQARHNSEFVERLDDGGGSRLVVCAPHGGMIEPYTDHQAELVAREFGGSATAWRCKGWRQGGGAFDRWHVSSTDLHRRSFPKLDAIADRGFEYAVSFHGVGESGVLVGGGASGWLKERFETEIQDALAGTGTDVRIVTDGPYDGDSPENVVNWLTEEGTNGIQIEQSYEVRSEHWRKVARAVAAVYRRLL